MKFSTKISASVVVVVGLFTATAVLAASSSPINSAQDIVNFFNNIGFWIGNIFWIIAAISGFWTAYLYIFAGGDAEKVARAHRQLLYTVIAIAIGLMTYGLPTLIGSILKGT